MQLSMGGKGNESPGGGAAGDLLILIEEQEDKDLKRDGNNLVFDLHVSFVDAALGTSVEVPSVGGKVRIKIDPGTQSGKILRLRGKGLKDINEKCLPIFSRTVLAKIKSGDSSWEEMVPPEVAKIIRERQLLGYLAGP